MATKKKQSAEVPVSLDIPTMLEPILRESRYVGPCAVQTASGWTRYGPTFYTKDGFWITFGYGLRYWGTTQGLAELVSSDTANPEWHALGWSTAGPTCIVFHASQTSINKYDRVAELTKLVENWIKNNATNSN